MNQWIFKLLCQLSILNNFIPWNCFSALGCYWLGTEDWTELLPWKSWPSNGSDTHMTNYWQGVHERLHRRHIRGALGRCQAPILLEANLQSDPSKSQRGRDISAAFWKLSRSFPNQDVWLRGRYIPVNQFRLYRKLKLFLKAPTTWTGSVNITCSEIHRFPKLDRSEKLYSSLW